MPRGHTVSVDGAGTPEPAVDFSAEDRASVEGSASLGRSRNHLGRSLLGPEDQV
jgi:hypothetical protein